MGWHEAFRDRKDLGPREVFRSSGSKFFPLLPGLEVPGLSLSRGRDQKSVGTIANRPLLH